MKTMIAAFMLLFTLGQPLAFAAGGGDGHGAHVEITFPKPVTEYDDADLGLVDRLQSRYQENKLTIWFSLIFLGGIIHAFMTGKLNQLAHWFEERHRQHLETGRKRKAEEKPQVDAEDDKCFFSTLFHYLGEVEVVFGLWLIPLGVLYASNYGFDTFQHFVQGINFTEPLFVVCVMAVAASRPITQFAQSLLGMFAKLGKGSPKAWWFSIMTITPIFGSFITEPAAMTIAALLLGVKFYELRPSKTFAYGTLGLLFVNISVGGTLTHFAAPPVLMVAAPWEWDLMYMTQNFGIWAVGGIIMSNLLYLWFFRKDFAAFPSYSEAAKDDTELEVWERRKDPIPILVTVIHLLFLTGTVVAAHTPALFIGLFLFYLGFVQATQHHQNRTPFRGALLVGFFLGALMVHGKFQGWWIDPVLTSLGEVPLFFGSTVLTAFNDNAAITYLATQAPGLGEMAKQAVVAGAVVGGGLTVIANAPNPAGQNILQGFFPGGITPGGLFKGALVPTIIMGIWLMVPRLLLAAS